jgi:hypothetical protein
MNKLLIFALLLIGFMSLAKADGENAEVERFVCSIPSDSEKNFYDLLIYGVGRSVLVSKGDTWFSDAELCMFSWYVSDKFSLAGYSWITHHALLKIMSADPEQFFAVIKKHNPAGYRVWRDHLEIAEIWLYGNECPNPSPLDQAARSIDGFNFKDKQMDAMRVDVLRGLQALTCRVPD